MLIQYLNILKFLTHKNNISLILLDDFLICHHILYFHFLILIFQNLILNWLYFDGIFELQFYLFQDLFYFQKYHLHFLHHSKLQNLHNQGLLLSMVLVAPEKFLFWDPKKHYDSFLCIRLQLKNKVQVSALCYRSQRFLLFLPLLCQTVVFLCSHQNIPDSQQNQQHHNLGLLWFLAKVHNFLRQLLVLSMLQVQNEQAFHLVQHLLNILRFPRSLLYENDLLWDI